MDNAFKCPSLDPSGAGVPGNRVCARVTRDGLRQYFYALTAHCGKCGSKEGKRKPVWYPLAELLYGQFRKVKVGYRLKQVYAKMLCGNAWR